jgi:hypothetical protein
MAESVRISGRREPPTVAQRLAAVDELLRGVVTDAGGLWSRAAVWILRIALEQSVDQVWLRLSPVLATCSMRAQLLALEACAGADVAGRTATLWSTLSRAGHHQDYELAPTVTELRGWYDETAVLTTELAGVGEP